MPDARVAPDPDDGVPAPDAAPDPDDGVLPPDAAPDPDDGVLPPDAAPDPDARVVPPDAAPDPDAALGCDGPAGCVTTIYGARTAIENGTRVTVEGVVTGNREDTIIVLQLPPLHRDYDGPEFSGIWVFLGNAADGIAAPARGRTVRLTGETNDRFGQRQLHNVTEIRLLDPLPEPPPQRVTPAAAMGDALETVIVEVTDVQVTDAAPEPGPGDAAQPFEFEVTGGLRVDDFLHRTPFPANGTRYDRITGVMRLSNTFYKLEPRDADDVEGGEMVELADGIVVNEIDYDQPGGDAAEYVELYNAGNQPVALAGLTLELFNGNDLMPYETFALADAGRSLAPQGFLVIAPAAVQTPPAALRIVAERDENLIQNGPDGVRLVGGGGAVIDSVGYGREVVPGATEGDANAPSDSAEVEGRSVGRCPDGADSDRNAADFLLTDGSPGRVNTCR